MESNYLGFLWMLYYFLHSALATDRIKEFLQNNFPNIVKSYRSIYSFFAIANFLLLGWFHTLVNSEFLFNQNQITMGIGVFFCWTGAGIVFIALKSYPFSFWFSDNGSSALVRQG